MELFRRGEWDSLLEYASQEGREAMAPRRGPQEVEEGRAERETISLVMQGELSRAIQKLESGAMAIPGPEVLDELVRLHPEPTPGFERPPDPGVPAMTLNRDIFEQFVQELPRARAPGTTQLRHMHLQSVIQHGGKDALYDLCNDILRGGVPADLQPFFAGARLFALEKAQGGIRPIACGEVLRRLVASMAAKQMRAGLLEYFAPGPEDGVQRPAQLGVGARGGSDVMVRGIQTALDAHPNWVCMTVDYTNAFNAGSRAVMLQEVAKRFPSLYPFVRSCYALNPCMTYAVGAQLYKVLSQEGCQQGDPLGSALFALLLQPILARLMRDHPDLPMLVSYLDDTVLLGPPQVVAEAFTTLVRLGGEMAGLQVNPSKCAVWAPREDTSLRFFPLMIVGASGRRLRGVIVLGIPVGSDDFVREKIQEIVTGKALVLSSIDKMRDPQIAHLLLSFCVRPRVMHLLRVCKPDLCRDAMKGFHDRVMQSYAGPTAAVMVGPPLDHVARQWAETPCRYGGAGLVRPDRIAESAYLGSFALVWA